LSRSPPADADGTHLLSLVRFGFRGFRLRHNRHEHAAFGAGLEGDLAVREREDREVLAEADVLARVPLGAALTDEDVVKMAEYYGYGLDPGSEFD
jgi:hypothetical protein